MVFRRDYIFESACSGNGSYADNASILEMLTSVSEAHTDSVGIHLPENIVWMVLDWKLRIKRRPETGESCCIRTWVTQWNKIFGIRCYDITGKNGDKCAEISSRWVLANKETRKLFRMTPDIMDLYGVDTGISTLETEPFIKNIARDLVCLKSCETEVNENMFDKNGHVHNTVYSTLAESVLPAGSCLDSVDISYRKEIDRNRKIELDYCIYQGNNLVLIKTEKDPAPNAIVLYNK